MGPQLVRCGMLEGDEQTEAEKQAASMGPQLVRCGMFGRHGRQLHGLHASMGPQLVRCGML